MKINRSTYEEFFLLYVDGELNASERKAVEDFAEAHPDLKVELELLQSSVLSADNTIVFENKEELYQEEEKKVIVFGWWKMIAAAILLIGFGTFGWLYVNEQDGKPAPAVAETNTIKTDKKNQTVNAGVDKPVVTENNKIENKTQQTAEKATAVRKAVVINKSEDRVNDKPEMKQPEISKPENVTNIVREPSDINIDMVKIDEQKEAIDINVTPRKIEEEIKEPKADAIYARHEIVDQQDDNDIIYFANTSFSKRNKLRGAFRKATRFIDKVTSLQ